MLLSHSREGSNRLVGVIVDLQNGGLGERWNLHLEICRLQFLDRASVEFQSVLAIPLGTFKRELEGPIEIFDLEQERLFVKPIIWPVSIKRKQVKTSQKRYKARTSKK